MTIISVITAMVISMEVAKRCVTMRIVGNQDKPMRIIVPSEPIHGWPKAGDVCGMSLLRIIRCSKEPSATVCKTWCPGKPYHPFQP